MTNQEAFDRVVIHLRKQGRPSLGSSGQCLYRSPKGLRCAVGVLITDEFYCPELEGRSVVTMYAALLTALPGVSLEMLKNIQDIHDLCPSTEWETQFYHLARRFDLIVPILITDKNSDHTGIDHLISV